MKSIRTCVAVYLAAVIVTAAAAVAIIDYV